MVGFGTESPLVSVGRGACSWIDCEGRECEDADLSSPWAVGCSGIVLRNPSSRELFDISISKIESLLGFLVVTQHENSEIFSRPMSLSEKATSSSPSGGGVFCPDEEISP